MMCKMGLKLNENVQKGLILLGAFTLVSGLIVMFAVGETGTYNIGLFSGMLSGLGAASLVAGTVNWIKIKRMSLAELEKQRNQLNDERNQSIVNNAARVTVMIVGLVGIVAALVAAVCNHVEVTFTLVGMIYTILIVFVLASNHFEKTL